MLLPSCNKGTYSKRIPGGTFPFNADRARFAVHKCRCPRAIQGASILPVFRTVFLFETSLAKCRYLFPGGSWMKSEAPAQLLLRCNACFWSVKMHGTQSGSAHASRPTRRKFLGNGRHDGTNVSCVVNTAILRDF